MENELRELDKFITERFYTKYEEKYEYADFSINELLHIIKQEYDRIINFKVNENIWENGQEISDECHYYMRLKTQYYLTKAFQAMKIDLVDENVQEVLSEGNIGTPGRVAKTWTGANLNDNDELLSGRWNKEPRMASFKSDETKAPVFVETSLDAVCSHHLIRFGDDNTDTDSFVVVGYYPENEFGGISKINRYVRWCSTRGWLQESLTNYIGNKIKEKFKTESVYVGIFNAKHGCASFRGARDRNASTSTVFISGKFKEDINLIPQKYRG